VSTTRRDRIADAWRRRTNAGFMASDWSMISSRKCLAFVASENRRTRCGSSSRRDPYVMLPGMKQRIEIQR
jgi:hypothetical protein